MTIGINGNEANVTHRVGIGQYAFELLRHFPKLRVYLSSQPLSDMPDMDYQVIPGHGLWTLTSLQKQLISEKDRPAVFFTPTHYAPLYLPMPSVISIMDMSFERFPQYFNKKDLYQLKYWTWASALQAKKILTISEFSKDEICAIYRLPRNKVIVTYPGYDRQRFNPKAKGQNKYGDYILFLGTLQPRKNLERLIEAFLGLKTDCKLVITGMINEGRGGWMNENIKASRKVILTGFIPDKEVPVLMANAKAYILPSLYEGFGIPPIEAMATGVPVVVSKVSSLPEICGDAAIYIDDPESVPSIKASLEKVLSLSAGQRQKRIDFGLDWVKRYNWKDTAKKTLGVLYEAAQR